MKKIFVLILLITCNAYAGLTIEPIIAEKDLQQGVVEANKAFDHFFTQEKSLSSQDAQKIQDHRDQQLSRLSERKNPKDVFIKDGKINIGFVATHLDENDSERVIMDKAHIQPNLIQDRQLVGQAMETIITFIKNEYPDATKVWAALSPAQKTLITLLSSSGFKESDYMDLIHKNNSMVFQGWEKSLIE